jgi:trimeric autotransporter adhesin
MESAHTMKTTIHEILQCYNANRRNSVNHASSTHNSFLISLVIVCFGLLPQAQAVTPTPDGCYPNYTTAEGCNALNFLTTGAGNTGLGWYSLFSNTTGSFNTGVGGGALALNNGDSNTAVGAAALLLNTTGTENTATGTDALVHNDIGVQNTATGAFALFNNAGSTDDPNRPRGEPGSFNTANGARALFNNTTGGENTAIGIRALFSNTIGGLNTAIGGFALSSNTEGGSNAALGNAALLNNTTGNGNIALGAFAGMAVTDANSVIAIGANGTNVSNSCFIGQIYSNIQPQVGTDPDLVTINSSGRLGRANVSSRRYKHDIQPMDKASEVLYRLEPVSFRYKKEYDATQTIAFGLIAEDVARVNPDLVGRNPEGQPESVRYEQINAMLLNEFLKEHRKVEDLKKDFQATVAQQQKEIAALVATVKKQASQIQKVSAQLEASKPAPQVVGNP